MQTDDDKKKIIIISQCSDLNPVVCSLSNICKSVFFLVFVFRINVAPHLLHGNNAPLSSLRLAGYVLYKIAIYKITKRESTIYIIRKEKFFPLFEKRFSVKFS